MKSRHQNLIPKALVFRNIMCLFFLEIFKKIVIRLQQGGGFTLWKQIVKFLFQGLRLWGLDAFQKEKEPMFSTLIELS